MLQVIFHGVDRSPAMEADIAERLEALKRLASTIGECKVTISKEGHQGLGSFSVKIDLAMAGRSNVVAQESDPVATAAVNKVLDSFRGVVFDEFDKGLVRLSLCLFFSLV